MTNREDPSVTDSPNGTVSEVVCELLAAIARQGDTLRVVADALTDLARAAQQALAESGPERLGRPTGEAVAQAARDMAEVYGKRYNVRPGWITLPALSGQSSVSVKFETGVCLLQAGWVTWAHPERKRALDALPPEQVRRWG